MERGDDDFVDLEEDFFLFLFHDVLDYLLVWWFIVYII
jgi:hypothetical protein